MSDCDQEASDDMARVLLETRAELRKEAKRPVICSGSVTPSTTATLSHSRRTPRRLQQSAR